MKKHTHIALSAIAALSLAACGGSGDSAADTTASPDSTAVSSSPTNPAAKVGTVEISVTVGTDSSADRVEKVALGAQVTLTLTNPDADDEFHLHGYDMTTGETKKGETSTITFIADKAGEFEVESHVSEQVYVTIVVE
mgnify:FL=1